MIEVLDPVPFDVFEARMRHLAAEWKNDPEAFHVQADDLLLETLRRLGYEAGCDAFDAEERWYA